MEPFALERLTVAEGDLSRLREPGGRYIAAVVSEDDYGNVKPDSHWAALGDTVRLRYVERFEYYDPETGAVYPDGTDLDTVPWRMRAAEYRDVEYTVAARVIVPYAFSYRYYGDDAFLLDNRTFLQDTGTDCVMYYAFDTTPERAADMERFLSEYTQNEASQLDYESKFSYMAEFEQLRGMFLLLGGALSFVVALVGVLNFVNAVVTGIHARRRELAVLQAVGMTRAQLRTMLALEGLLYAAGAEVLALALVLASAPALRTLLDGTFWFLTYRFVLWPALAALPVFALLGAAIPALSGRLAQRRSVIERLREE